MNLMDIFIKQFIEDNIDLIENDNWDEIYNSKIPLNFGNYSYTGRFTQAILECDINPLNYMKEVPEAYMYESISPDLNIYIPEGVEKISKCAFHNALIKSLHIPKSVNKINMQGWALPKNVPIYVPYEDFYEFGSKVIIPLTDWDEYILYSSITGKKIYTKSFSFSPSKTTTKSISDILNEVTLELEEMSSKLNKLEKEYIKRIY